jgi:hypothetical protein
MSFDRKHLETITRLVEKTNHQVPFWLEDLLLLGPRFDEWKLGALRPNRVLLTEMLLWWAKNVGLSAEESLEWLMPYCCEVLALTSKSGPSAIRHGTKANTRWVYKSNFGFNFEEFVGQMPEAAFQNTPPYMPIFARWWELLAEAKQKARDSYVPPVFLPVLPVKKRFREQYEKSLAFARQKEAEGLALREIMELLNTQGMPTCTGRKWTEGNLHRALHRTPFVWRKAGNEEPPPADSPPPEPSPEA